MSKTLSIIVPSYNVEQYLNQTLDSFLDKSILDDIEVLIVDDGSKDKTASIGKSYEERFPNTFHLVSKKNGGHGSTINKGIELASGKYFKVIDGDDWVNTSDFVKLINALKNCNADYVMSNYYELDDITQKETPKVFDMLKQDCLMPFSEVANKILMPMHALVIKTSILKDNHISLDEYCFYVDVEYVLFPIPYVHTVAYFDLYVYMYRLAVVTQSVSMQGFQRNIEHHMKVILHLTEFLNEYVNQNGDSNKIQYIATRIAQMIDTQTDIFLSFPTNNIEIREKFKQFDETIRLKSKLIYEMSGEYRTVLRLLRKTNFKNYKAIVTLSNIRNRKQETLNEN